MKNMVYIQSGGPTSVINTSLYGAIKEAKKHTDEIDHVYGSLNGIEGMIDDKLIDIGQEDEEQIEKFLQNFPEFSLQPISIKNNLNNKIELNGNFMKLSPANFNTDGFFAAVMRKAVS